MFSSERCRHDVFFVENVTDVDDKIILRAHMARVEAVLAAVRIEPLSLRSSAAILQARTAVSVVPAAQTARVETLISLLAADAGKSSRDTKISSLAETCATLAAEVAALVGLDKCTGELAPLASAWDVAAGVASLARRFEAEFLLDMDSLGVMRPDALTRVSEYIQPIVEYIATIVRKGLAYESCGSVYFDVAAFTALPDRRYGKLLTLGSDEAGLAAEGEGSLGGGGMKRCARDFVLWKASKPAEPAWGSPWGPGRPGWHIECSAMASDLLGGAVDINGGGCDLAFPHHENQVAQSEAYWDKPTWVNFFVHTGHLHIEGLKMSKSLKNFVTIRAALGVYSARQLRILFLLQHWAEPMELTPLADGRFSQCEAAVAAERTFAEFFHSAASLQRSPVGDGAAAWGARDGELASALDSARAETHAALCDSVDTPRAMRALLSLVRSANTCAAPPQPAGAILRLSVARFVSHTLGCFGLATDVMGFGTAETGADATASSAALVDALVVFRDSIRALAKSSAPPAAILAACDALRDATLPPLGVHVDDRPTGGALWKRVDPEEAKREAERDEAARLAKEAAKVAARQEAERRAREKEAALAVPPHLLFRSPPYASQFSSWDDAGMPTLDSKGEELSKGSLKKLTKALEAHKLVHTPRKDAPDNVE